MMVRSNDKRFLTVGIYTLLLCMSIVILYPVVFAREGSFFIIGDNLHQSYTFLNKLSIALHKGYLPVWDANTFGGKNFRVNYRPASFIP